MIFKKLNPCGTAPTLKWSQFETSKKITSLQENANPDIANKCASWSKLSQVLISWASSLEQVTFRVKTERGRNHCSDDQQYAARLFWCNFDSVWLPCFLVVFQASLLGSLWFLGSPIAFHRRPLLSSLLFIPKLKSNLEIGISKLFSKILLMRSSCEFESTKM